MHVHTYVRTYIQMCSLVCIQYIRTLGLRDYENFNNHNNFDKNITIYDYITITKHQNTYKLA